MRRAVGEGLPVVVKVGSSSLVGQNGGLRGEAVERVATMVARLWRRGHPAILVTSAAVAAGFPALGLTERPQDLTGLQVAAAVGQGRLMQAYTDAFGHSDLVVGQVLLTRDVFADRSQYLHAGNALRRLLSAGVVPVVNENDTVAVEGLKMGDNDRLAAMVSHLAGAGMLVILTDTDGLFDSDPTLADAALLEAVKHNDAILDELSGVGRFGSGGVGTKVMAARMAAWSGVPTVIAKSTDENIIDDAIDGKPVGTWVEPMEEGLPARKLWIAFGKTPHGRISIDEGAVRALVRDGRSLLAVGVTDVHGDFETGDVVDVDDHTGSVVARGLASMSSATLEAVYGQRGRGEAIHRDHMVVLG
ncbi:MAG: glutamate 5-kinase [Acidimicrobiia bacterium]|nr:glutamate 5-kinase [Acidimicrobiia bacterium]